MVDMVLESMHGNFKGHTGHYNYLLGQWVARIKTGTLKRLKIIWYTGIGIGIGIGIDIYIEAQAHVRTHTYAYAHTHTYTHAHRRRCRHACMFNSLRLEMIVICLQLGRWVGCMVNSHAYY